MYMCMQRVLYDYVQRRPNFDVHTCACHAQNYCFTWVFALIVYNNTLHMQCNVPVLPSAWSLCTGPDWCPSGRSTCSSGTTMPALHMWIMYTLIHNAYSPSSFTFPASLPIAPILQLLGTHNKFEGAYYKYLVFCLCTHVTVTLYGDYALYVYCLMYTFLSQHIHAYLIFPGAADVVLHIVPLQRRGPECWTHDVYLIIGLFFLLLFLFQGDRQCMMKHWVTRNFDICISLYWEKAQCQAMIDRALDRSTSACCLLWMHLLLYHLDCICIYCKSRDRQTYDVILS